MKGLKGGFQILDLMNADECEVRFQRMLTELSQNFFRGWRELLNYWGSCFNRKRCLCARAAGCPRVPLGGAAATCQKHVGPLPAAAAAC